MEQLTLFSLFKRPEITDLEQLFTLAKPWHKEARNDRT